MTSLEKAHRDFAQFAAKLKGDEKSEAQTFLFHLLAAFGHDPNTLPSCAASRRAPPARSLPQPRRTCSSGIPHSAFSTLHSKARLRDAHAALDSAVRSTYGMNATEDPIAFLLKLNLGCAENENKGESITPPGLPGALIPSTGDFITLDSISPLGGREPEPQPSL